MGVRKLRKFLDENGHTVEVDLKKLANEWRSNGGNPVIVVDGLNVCRMFVKDITPFCGGEFKKLKEILGKFIDAFKGIGVELFFSFDGPMELRKKKIWVRRRREKLSYFESVFKQIEKIPLKDQTLDDYPILTTYLIRQVVCKKCKLLCGMDNYDQEMAQYVVEKKCLGILSEDTDFLIFEQIPHVFTHERFDISTMKTYEYCRSSFVQSLDLNFQALPFFATLMGNDFVEFEDSKAYQRAKKYFRMPLFDVVYDIAGTANRIYEKTGEDREKAALFLSREIYQNEYKQKDMLESLLSYAITEKIQQSHSHTLSENMEWDRMVAQCLRKYVQGDFKGDIKFGAWTLSVITQLRFTQAEKFEDPYSPCSPILAPLRKKIYSVLLHGKCSEPGGSEFVEELIAAGVNSFEKKVLVRTLPVDVEHPGLLRLWNEDPSLDETRWKLLYWMLCSRDSHLTFNDLMLLKNLPENFISLALLLCYLFQIIKQINSHELAVLSLMIGCLPEMTSDNLDEFSSFFLDQNRFTTKRAVTLSALYQQTYLYICWILFICGLKTETDVSNCYGGLLFHTLLQRENLEEFFPYLLAKGMTKAVENYHIVKSAVERCHTSASYTPMVAPTPSSLPIPTSFLYPQFGAKSTQ